MKDIAPHKVKQPLLDTIRIHAFRKVLSVIFGKDPIGIYIKGYAVREPCASRSGNATVIEIENWSTAFSCLTRPRMAIGEAYQKGLLSVVQGELSDFIASLLRAEKSSVAIKVMSKLNFIAGFSFNLRQRYGVSKSIDNVHSHYDIGNSFYSRLIGPSMTYSCAFFENESDTLEEAQERKYRTIIERLNIQPGNSVVEVGCGWGGLSREISNLPVSRVSAVTISEEQYKYCQKQRVADGRLVFKFQDYRELAESEAGTFDRLASVGMFEHVGRSQFETYFRAIRDLLKPGGQALVHTIIRDGKGRTNPWIDRYVFPGGYIASISEVEEAVRRVSDISLEKAHVHEGINYVRTLSSWENNLRRSRSELVERYDEFLLRTFEFYLAGSKAAFSDYGMKVCQFVITRR